MIAILYCFELLIYLFHSPDVDAINGLKMAAQGQKPVVAVVPAVARPLLRPIAFF